MSGKRFLAGLGLTGFWPFRTKNWNNEMNENLLRLSAMTGRVTVESRLTAVADFDKTKMYLVPGNSGSNPNKIAVFNNDPVVADQAWIYITPKEGWTAYIVNEAIEVDYLYGAWAPAQFTFSKSYMETGYDQRWLTDLVLTAGFTQAAGRQVLRYRRAMTYIDLDFELSTAAAVADDTAIFTLPVGYRPPMDIILPVANYSVPLARVLLSASGQVRAYNFNNPSIYSFHGRFSLL